MVGKLKYKMKSNNKTKIINKQKIDTLIKQIDPNYTYCEQCRTPILKSNKNKYNLSIIGKTIYMCKNCVKYDEALNVALKQVQNKRKYNFN